MVSPMNPQAINPAAESAVAASITDFLPILSHKYPPAMEPGIKERVQMKMNSPDCDSDMPSFWVRKRVRKGNTKFPMLFAIRAKKSTYIALGRFL